MPPLHALPVFAVAAIVLLVIPGPAVLYIATRSAVQGRRAGLVSVLGVHVGTLVHITAAAAGVSAIVAASALAFSAVKIAGAVYLLWLGLATLLGRRERSEERRRLEHRTPRQLFVDGILVNVLNPKTALFFLAFLPQFVDPDGAPVWQQTVVLGVLFGLLGLMSDSLYALAGASVGRWLRSRRADRAWRSGQVFEGGVLMALGVVTLATPHRHTT